MSECEAKTEKGVNILLCYVNRPVEGSCEVANFVYY